MSRIKTAILICLLFSFSRNSWSQSVNDIIREIREGRVKEAKSLLLQLEQLNPDKDYILFLHGLVSVNGDTATRYYEDLLTKFPGSGYCDDAHFRIGQYHYVRGLYRQALKDFNQIIQKYENSPLHPHAHYWIGLCYQATDQADSAQIRFQRVKDLSGSDDLIHLADLALEGIPALGPVSDTTTEIEESTIRYAVQVGAFSQQTNALLRKSFFESKGYQVDLRTKVKDNTLLYLVWIGSFPTAEEARQFGMDIKNKYGVRYTIASEEK